MVLFSYLAMRLGPDKSRPFTMLIHAVIGELMKTTLNTTSVAGILFSNEFDQKTVAAYALNMLKTLNGPEQASSGVNYQLLGRI